MDKFTAIKREPCHKCGQPVFLAERFCIGSALYHRKCLKCARCSTQLSAGSFYETEIDGEFCCETCPDEETTMKREERSESEEKRFSVADKVALFQRVDLELTKRSLSDEEKKASLQRLANLSLVSHENSIEDATEHELQGVEELQETDSSSSSSSEESEAEDDDKKILEEELPEANLTNATTEKTIEIEQNEITTTECDIAALNVEVVNNKSEIDKLENDTLVNDTIECLIKQEVEEIVTSVLQLAQEKVQLIKNEQDLLNASKQTISVEIDEVKDEFKIETVDVTNNEEVLVEENLTVTTPIPTPRSRTLERRKKNEEAGSGEMKVVVLSPAEKPPIREKPAIPLKPPIKPRPVSIFLKKEYPEGLNPFGSEDEEESKNTKPANKSMNPFGSDTEEEEEHKETEKKQPSTNPFGSEDEDEYDSLSRTTERESNRSSKRTPVPTPRKLPGTPTNAQNRHTLSVQNLAQHSFSNLTPEFHGSSSSLALSDGTIARRKKKKAPAPPSLNNSTATDVPNTPPSKRNSHAENFDYESEGSTSSKGLGSGATSTPIKSAEQKHKKRKAPAPPTINTGVIQNKPDNTEDTSIISDSGLEESIESMVHHSRQSSEGNRQKLIPLCEELVEKYTNNSETSSIVSNGTDTIYRRKIVPLSENPKEESKQLNDDSSVCQSIKSSNQTDENVYINKSDKGKWKRRKGPAPALPVEVRKSIKVMSPEDIKRELDVIELQQLGLEKQGVMLEKIIREKCEGPEAELTQMNPKAVEELIMQLFDVVNEKNELFRRQAELMYMRRQHRLELEQQELDQEIRNLMSQPEENKTDSEKTREEALITRLIEVVKLRNEVVDSLESDRIREKEEDASIRQSIEKHAAKFEQFAQKAHNKLKKVKKEKKSKDKSKSIDPETGEKPKKKKNVFNRLILTKHKEHKEKDAVKS